MEGRIDIVRSAFEWLDGEPASLQGAQKPERYCRLAGPRSRRRDHDTGG